MQCQECENLLSDYLDHAIEPHLRKEVEAHLAVCSGCAAVHTELCQLLAASELLLPQVSGPTIRAHRVPQPGSDAISKSPNQWFFLRIKELLFERYVEIKLTIPQFSAVVGIVGGLVLFGFWSLQNPTSLSQGEPRPVFANPASPGTSSPVFVPTNHLVSHSRNYQAERVVLTESITRLSKALETRKMDWDPELRRVFERNMALIDQSLLECEVALRSNPHDFGAEEMLIAAYREKLRLLQEFAAI
ncbi:MAG: zf-HC2 domain-containing protein [Acidobacteria bacterium]|nr:zf-HC2 domain-containing protein [Acidobacteriota bacterium]